MHKLSNKFKPNTIQELNRLPKAIREAIMEEYEVRFMEDLPEDGHITIQVPVKDPAKIESLKSRIADAMNIDDETVDHDEEQNVLYAEMTIGSSDMPWPLFAYQMYCDVNEAVNGLGHNAEAIF